MTVQELQTLKFLKCKYEIEDSERKRKEPPIKLDINNLKRTLKDFGIEVEIPTFNTYAELEAWQHEIIKDTLNTYSQNV